MKIYKENDTIIIDFQEARIVTKSNPIVSLKGDLGNVLLKNGNFEYIDDDLEATGISYNIADNYEDELKRLYDENRIVVLPIPLKSACCQVITRPPEGTSVKAIYFELKNIDEWGKTVFESFEEAFIVVDEINNKRLERPKGDR